MILAIGKAPSCAETSTTTINLFVSLSHQGFQHEACQQHRHTMGMCFGLRLSSFYFLFDGAGRRVPA